MLDTGKLVNRKIHIMGKDLAPYKILVVGKRQKYLEKLESRIRKRIADPMLVVVENLGQAEEAFSESMFDTMLLVESDCKLLASDIQNFKKNAGGCQIITIGKSRVLPGTYDSVPVKKMNSWLLYKTIVHAVEKKRIKKVLLDSTQRYSDLFHLNPLPMWAYHVDSLRFFMVNEAAIREYGYSKEEYMQMSIRDIRPEEELAVLESAVDAVRKEEKLFSSGVYRHQKKSGEVITVEILSNIIYIAGEKYELVMANNISERLRHIETIERRNQQLREIAYGQSHIVRAPLANILGILHLAKDMDLSSKEGTELMERLFECGCELDRSIAQIVIKTAATDSQS